MRDIFDKEFVKEMDDFFDYIDGILDRDEDEVDVITDHLDEPMTDEEVEYLEMKAELHHGVQIKRFYLSITSELITDVQWGGFYNYSFSTPHSIN